MDIQMNICWAWGPGGGGRCNLLRGHAWDPEGISKYQFIKLV